MQKFNFFKSTFFMLFIITSCSSIKAISLFNIPENVAKEVNSTIKDGVAAIKKGVPVKVSLDEDNAQNLGKMVKDNVKEAAGAAKNEVLNVLTKTKYDVKEIIDGVTTETKPLIDSTENAATKVIHKTKNDLSHILNNTTRELQRTMIVGGQSLGLAAGSIIGLYILKEGVKQLFATSRKYRWLGITETVTGLAITGISLHLLSVLLKTVTTRYEYQLPLEKQSATNEQLVQDLLELKTQLRHAPQAQLDQNNIQLSQEENNLAQFQQRLQSLNYQAKQPDANLLVLKDEQQNLGQDLHTLLLKWQEKEEKWKEENTSKKIQEKLTTLRNQIKKEEQKELINNQNKINEQYIQDLRELKTQLRQMPQVQQEQNNIQLSQEENNLTQLQQELEQHQTEAEQPDANLPELEKKQQNLKAKLRDLLLRWQEKNKQWKKEENIKKEQEELKKKQQEEQVKQENLI